MNNRARRVPPPGVTTNTPTERAFPCPYQSKALAPGDLGISAMTTGRTSDFRSHTKYRKLRRRIFAREKGLCRQCREQGRTTAATQLDHIVPVFKGGDKYEESNLQPLCDDCHDDKTEIDKGRDPVEKAQWDALLHQVLTE